MRIRIKKMLGSFRGQLALWFGGMSLVSLVAAGFYIGQIATSDVETFGGESLYASANSAAALLSVNLRERELEIDLLRHSPLFTKGDLSGSEVRHALELRKAAHNEYAWIGVASPDGRVLQATNGLLVDQQVNQRPWFKAGQTAVYTGDIHEAVLLFKHLPNLAPDQPLRFLDFAAPIIDDKGKLRGVLAAHVLWNWVTDTVESAVMEDGAQRDAEVLIADREGNILYPFNLVGQFQPPA